MKNASYWKNLAGMIDTRETIDYTDAPKDRLKSLALECYQKGIILILSDNLQEGHKFIRDGSDLIWRKIKDNKEAEDFLWLFIDKLLLSDNFQKGRLRRALDMMSREIYSFLMRKGQLDLVNFYRNIEKEWAEELERTLKKSEHLKRSNSVYPYKNTASRFIRYSRIKLLADGAKKAQGIAKAGRLICYLAVQNVHHTMAEEDHRWEPLEYSQVDVSSFTREAMEKYIETRKSKLGAIPDMTLQSNIIENLARALNERTDVKKPLNTLREYFATSINPPGRPEVKMGILEELEWAALRKKFEEIVSPEVKSVSNADVFREYLG